MRDFYIKILPTVLALFPFWAIGQSTTLSGTVYKTHDAQPLSGVNLFIQALDRSVQSDSLGSYVFQGIKSPEIELIIFAEGYLTQSLPVKLEAGSNDLDVFLDSLELDLATIEVEAKRREEFGLSRLNNVEGLGIYAGKKSEVIELENIVANLATNNPRQVYKNIAGLNIWESDGAGLQLSIGARGLDPNRTANFNTRQNGYDISADALGYPESYYTPPTQALRRIEIVRGAASLQYGPQFGGLLNFILKKGPRTKKLEFTTENTVGSWGLLNSFTSLGGEHSGWNYYGYIHYKQGNSWRPNAQFDQKGGYLFLEKALGQKWKFSLEYTHMDYLAQQPGGLQDFQFNTDPAQSFRSRNWFDVNWDLAALNIDYKFSDKTKINSRSFILNAERQALGALNPINRPDPLTERDLIVGQYNNFGTETRLIHRYTIKERITTFLVGLRYYKGLTQNEQGLANDESDANFSFLNPKDLERSDYQFPSQNFSAFVENLFYLSDKISITPGLRFEHIKTASDGFFKERIFSGDSLLLEIKNLDARNNKRNFILAGVGIGYKPINKIEVYTNFSQNYRSINFSDLAVVNPNLLIDSLLSDERGFNIDLGLRGKLFKEAVQLDFSLFYLNYKNRIGITELIIDDPIIGERAVAYTTNIGNAFVYGFESYLETNLWQLLGRKERNFGANLFLNFSWLSSAYNTEDQKIDDNEVELVPPFTLKTGLNLRFKQLRLAYQYSLVEEHFTDATNATSVPDATRGIIPRYQVHDLSLSFTYRWLKIQTGMNNLFNAQYFTRRAVAYPGPGIIPSDPRSYYFTVGVKF